MFGNNEYRWLILKEIEWVCANDTGHPLHWTNYIHPFEVINREIFQRKAPLVMYMIERRVGTEAFRKVLSNLVNPTGEGDVLDRNLSTKKFLKMVRRLTGHDLRPFADRWIYGKGCPDFTAGFWFNRKKHILEFAFKQNKSPAGRVSGNLAVKVFELEGPYDYNVTFDDELHSFDFACHSRVRKARKKKKNAQEELPPPNPDAENEEPDQAKRNETPVLWVRVDPQLDWIRSLTIRMPEYMYIFQLEGDADVVAQYEAIRGLRTCVSSFKALECLNKTLADTNIFYRIRIEAARTMALNATTGLDFLTKYFKTSYFDKEGLQIRNNDFSNFAEYFIQKETAEIIASVKDKDGRTSPDVFDFVLDLVKNNDNSKNQYSDGEWVATLMRSMTHLNTPGVEDSRKKSKQLLRHLSLEKLIPSYHNSVTVAAIHAIADMMMRGTHEMNLGLFRDYTNYGHYEEVRIAAVQSLVRLNFMDSVEFLFNLLWRERCPSMSSVIAETMATPNVDDLTLSKFFLVDTSETVSYLVKSWNALNSSTTAYDCRYRIALVRLFQRLWGSGIPRFLTKERALQLFPKKSHDNRPVTGPAPPNRMSLKVAVPKPIPIKIQDEYYTSANVPTVPTVPTALNTSSTTKLKLNLKRPEDSAESPRASLQVENQIERPKTPEVQPVPKVPTPVPQNPETPKILLKIPSRSNLVITELPTDKIKKEKHKRERSEKSSDESQVEENVQVEKKRDKEKKHRDREDREKRRKEKEERRARRHRENSQVQLENQDVNIDVVDTTPTDLVGRSSLNTTRLSIVIPKHNVKPDPIQVEPPPKIQVENPRPEVKSHREFRESPNSDLKVRDPDPKPRDRPPKEQSRDLPRSPRESPRDTPKEVPREVPKEVPRSPRDPPKESPREPKKSQVEVKKEVEVAENREKSKPSLSLTPAQGNSGRFTIKRDRSSSSSTRTMSPPVNLKKEVEVEVPMSTIVAPPAPLPMAISPVTPRQTTAKKSTPVDDKLAFRFNLKQVRKEVAAKGLQRPLKKIKIRITDEKNKEHVLLTKNL
eukprot:TRINITY_DN1213_c4_g1_i3.p1 TRINITY_DN1213_c4_g1~~TRINITY_DN1213_c4_g1_i3.p1  ORF type:complete len:1045 (+),score=383.68 TRINITY_DN1213_c4_g1_i3:1199-4333(+)